MGWGASTKSHIPAKIPLEDPRLSFPLGQAPLEAEPAHRK